MKSKLVFFVLIFSLFLNISHDLLIANETTCECSSILVKADMGKSNDCCHGVCELHEIFHFSGILASPLNLNSASILSTKLFFISTISPIFIQDNAFKPPIV